MIRIKDRWVLLGRNNNETTLQKLSVIPFAQLTHHHLLYKLLFWFNYFKSNFLKRMIMISFPLLGS